MIQRKSLSAMAAAALTLVASRTSRADDLATIRQRAVDDETGGASTAPEVLAAQAVLVAAGQEALSTLDDNGRWPDVDYGNLVAGASWGLTAHFTRMRALARAYRTPGALHESAAVLDALTRAISRMRTFYCPTCFPWGNWWHWEIGAPRQLAPTLLLMQGALPDDVLDRAISSMVTYIGQNPVDAPFVGAPVNTGQNLAWNAFNHLYLGLIRNDAKRLQLVSQAIASTCQVVTDGGEGIQSDGSFHQHGAQLYTGGYGADFAADIASYAAFSEGTAYALDADGLATLHRYVATGTMWTLMGSQYDPAVIGREVTLIDKIGFEGLEALLRVSLVDSPYRDAVTSAAKKMVEGWPGPTFAIDVAPLVGQVKAASRPAQWPSGSVYFPNSDHAVHRRPSYYASVRMLSKRNLSGELINGQGKTQSRQADGSFYLTFDGERHFSDDVWPTLDWSRLPGITVERTASVANATYGKGTKTFVGGTSDGTFGAAAMDFAPVAASGSKVTARKAWFFFDDAIAFLTNGITCPTDNTVETIVEQWPVSSPLAPVVVEGTPQSVQPGWSRSIENATWAFADGIGYYFFDAPTVSATLGTRTGTWSKLGSGNDIARSHDYFTLLYDHGKRVEDARAAYVIVPATTADAMGAWAGERPVALLQNDEKASAAKDAKSNVLGVVFWSPGTIDGLSSDVAAVVTRHDDGQTITLSAADPGQGEGSITLVFDADAPLSIVTSDPGVDAKADGAHWTIAFPREGGVSHRLTLARPFPPDAGAGPSAPAGASGGDLVPAAKTGPMGGCSTTSSAPPAGGFVLLVGAVVVRLLRRRNLPIDASRGRPRRDSNR